MKNKTWAEIKTDERQKRIDPVDKENETRNKLNGFSGFRKKIKSEPCLVSNIHPKKRYVSIRLTKGKTK